MLSGLKQSYIQHHEARQSFLIRFQWFTLLLGGGIFSALLWSGSYLAAVSTGFFTLCVLATFPLRTRGYAFLCAVALSIIMLAEPTTAIVFSRGIESPYLIWLLVPMFVATGLLGARGGILAGITAVVTYIALYIWSEPINKLNELAPEYYEGMFFLSFVSAVAYCAAIAWIAVSAIEKESTQASEQAANSALKAIQLAESEKQLTRQIDEQKNLQAIIAHELRTPAATLKMLFDDHLSAQLADSERSTVNDLLEHLNSVMDDMQLVREPDRLAQATQTKGEFSAVMQAAVHMADRFVKDAQLEIELLPAQGEIPVLLPKQILRQITINLVKNCAVHANASRLRISMAYEVREQQAHYQVLFEDDGSGVPADYRSQIFEPFGRGDSQADGSGIGLAVCRDYARSALSGDLAYVDSELGGAGFQLTGVFACAKSNKSRKTSELPKAIEGQSVLLVEDSPVLQTLTKKMLEAQGAQVKVADDGINAMKVLGESSFDLILTDLHMPKMDGIELTKTLRALDHNVPIFGLTAAFGDESKLLMAAGANAILGKPLSVQALNKAIIELDSTKPPLSLVSSRG